MGWVGGGIAAGWTRTGFHCDKRLSDVREMKLPEPEDERLLPST